MFDQYMICPDSLRNDTSDGQITGYVFEAKLPYYRGLGLSMVEEVAVTLDGAPVPRAAIRLHLRGKSWSLDELETEFEERWNFGEIAKVQVAKPGGLTQGAHVVELAERLRISYLPFTPTTSDRKTLTIP